MLGLCKNATLVTRFIRNLRGGSQPILVQASDGLLYVVKFTNNLQGPNLPFNESAGSELYRAFGLAVPSWKPLLVTDAFLDQNRDCWMQSQWGSLRPESGLCFGSRFLGEEGVRLLEILPGTSFKWVRNRRSFWLAWLIDICAEHADTRQAAFIEDAEGWLNAYFIDMGHLFGGPKADLLKNFQVSSYLDSRIYSDISYEDLMDIHKAAFAWDHDQLRQRVQAIPAEWKQASALNRFDCCLQRLSKSLFLQNVLDTIIDAHERRMERGLGNSRNKRISPASVLCTGIQGARFERHPVSSRVCHPACA